MLYNTDIKISEMMSEKETINKYIMNTNSKYYNEYYDYVLKDIEPSSKTKKAVFNIIHDLTDRRGLKQEFNRIDGDIQDGIIDNWINQIDSAMT